jgi:hypothetical protein
MARPVKPDKRLTARRESWLRRPWRASENGNSFMNVRGFNVVVFASRKGYGIKIEQRYGERCQFGKRRFATRREAQITAFEALLWAEDEWGGNGRYDLPSAAPRAAPPPAGPA